MSSLAQNFIYFRTLFTALMSHALFKYVGLITARYVTFWNIFHGPFANADYLYILMYLLTITFKLIHLCFSAGQRLCSGWHMAKIPV